MEKSLIALDNQKLALSGIKQASRNDALIIRVFNTGDSRQQARLTFAAPVKEARYVNLNEELLPDRPVVLDGHVEITAAPKQIVTVAVRLAL